jgi:energy-coupling factor transporter ATP-binding protein EcfA2
MTLDEQLALVDKYATKAFASTLRLLKHNQTGIIAATRQGFIDGYAQYGDASWGLDYHELVRQALEEFRDANAYMTILRSRGWQM